MKKLRVLSVIAAAALMCSALSCGPDPKPVEEVKLTGISANADSAPKEFFVGQEFSYDGLIVKASYSDNSKKTVKDGFTASLSQDNLGEDSKIKRSSSEGHSEVATVTVSYEGFSDSYNVTISDVVTKLAIFLDKDAVKTSYNVGDELDTAGVTVKAFYSNDDTTGEDITDKVTISASLTSDASETPIDFATAPAGSYSLTFTASFANLSAESETLDNVVFTENLITSATVSGWNTDANATPSFTGSLEEGYSVDFLASSGQWNAQFKIQTNASVSNGDMFKFSFTANTSVAMSGITLKFDDSAEIYYAPGKFSTSGGKDESFVVAGKADKDVENILFVFDFGGNLAANVKISNLSFEIIDIENIVPETLSITPTEIYEGVSVDLSAKLNDLYPIDVEYTISTENGVSGSSISGNKLTAGNISGEANGTITVEVSYGSFKETVDITVKKIEKEDKDILDLVTNFNPGWGQKGSCSEENVTNLGGFTGEVVKFVNCNYQGWELKNTDASIYKGIAVEYYAEEGVKSIEVFPVAPGGADFEYKIQNNNIEVGNWTTAKYAFEEGKDNIHSKIFQLKFTVNDNAAGAAGNFYIKKIYFYAE